MSDRLDGTGEAGAGGRFVRNDQWTATSDPLRSALPDVIEIRDSIPVATILSRLVDDKAPDNTAIAIADIPPSSAAEALKDPAFAARSRLGTYSAVSTPTKVALGSSAV